MALITSKTLKGEAATMAKGKIAEKDIIVRNELGQNVVVVPKGQPIPDDFNEELYAAGSVPIRQADEEEPEPEPKPAKKKAQAAPENKRA